MSGADARPLQDGVRPELGRTALHFASVIAAAYIGAAWLTVVLVQWVAPVWSPLQSLIDAEGASKIMRRIVLLIVLIALPGLLRAFGWRGWTDCGLFVPGTRRLPDAWYRSWMRGVGWGILSLGPILLLMLSTGARVPDDGVLTPGAILAALGSGLISAVAVGLVEEVLARGILFRLLARAWGPLSAALVSSLLFSVGHFLRASESAFVAEGVGPAVWAVLISMGQGMAGTGDILVRVAVLTLMGLVLCAFLHRQGTVWFVAGLHTGWVVLKQVNGDLADVNREISVSFWLGQRSDATDAPLAVLMLLALLLTSLWSRRRETPRAA